MPHVEHCVDCEAELAWGEAENICPTCGEGLFCEECFSRHREKHQDQDDQLNT